VLDAFEGGPPDAVLVPRFDILRRHLWCLLPGQWLNDQIVNFYFKLVQEHSWRASGGPRCWCPNSFFWAFLGGRGEREYCYSQVQRWTRRARIDIFDLDFVMFPMNVGGAHWAMGAIDLKAKAFRYFDSMGGAPGSNFVPFLQRYVSDEHRAKRGGPLPGEGHWQLAQDEPSLPQQHNGFDCGVFTCLYAEHLGAGRPVRFGETNMVEQRLRLAARLLRARLD